jgi:NAD(P)-dependent dehydrogenase (short-subunit alcohol dehydrogenase family)
MVNKTVLVTGSTDGIGKQTAYELARMGYRVILHGRSPERVREVAEDLASRIANASLEEISADLSSLEQVRRMAAEITMRFPRLDVIINNAGVFNTTRRISQDGYELSLAVNHLAPYVLTIGLLDLLGKSAPARVVNVSSVAHKRGRINFDDLHGEKEYDGYKAYADSKLMLIYFTYDLADQIQGSGITVNALHPGVITTKMLTTGFNMTGDDLSVGAETPIFLAVSQEVAEISGKYFERKQAVPSSRLSYDLAFREQAMKVTKRLTKAD